MKKTFRLIGMALMAVLMSAGFAACSDDDDVPDDIDEASFVGTWELVDMEGHDGDISEHNSDRMKEEELGVTMTFYPDNTYSGWCRGTYYVFQAENKTTLFLSEIITRHWDSISNENWIVLKFSNNEFAIKFTDGSYSLKLTFERIE